jgi:hypothetical protein
VESFALLCDIAFYNYTKGTKKSQKPQRAMLIILYYRDRCDSILLAKVELVIKTIITNINLIRLINKGDT